MQDILAQFMPKFVTIARTRLDKIERELAVGGDSSRQVAASELHALAGEAALLGLTELGQLARQGEDALRNQPAEQGLAAGKAAASGLRRGVEQLQVD